MSDSHYESDDDHEYDSGIGELPEGWIVATSVTTDNGETLSNNFTNLGSALAYAMTGLMMGGVIVMGIAPTGSEFRTLVETHDVSTVEEWDAEHPQASSGSHSGSVSAQDDDEDPLGQI